MKKLIGMLGVSLLFLSVVAAFCQSVPVEGTITDEEYGIYKLVIAKPEGWTSVDQETLADVRVDAATMISAGGIQLDAGPALAPVWFDWLARHSIRRLCHCNPRAGWP